MRPFTDEQVIAAIDAAPPLVRGTVTSPKTAEIVATIGKKHNLHIDVIAEVAAMNRNLLIGLSSPAEVVGTLVMLGISSESAKSILNDLNQQIFMPLRSEMRNAEPIGQGNAIPQAEPRKPEPIPPLSLSQAPTAAPAAPIAAVNRLATPSITTLPGSSEPAPMPAASAPVAASVPAPIPSGERPVARTMAHDMEQVRHPERAPEPPRAFVDAPAEPAWRPAAPAIPAASAPLRKEYGADPYREPI